MATLALVGNAPSSGSTFLSDLLDCSPISASGPELNLFSNTRLYDYVAYRKAPLRCGASASVYTTRNCICRGDLPAYGLDIVGYERLVRQCNDLPAFIQAFSARFLALRGKDASGTVFEKTPENINAIGPFLSAYPEGWFVYVVRNPIYVYTSLLKRGFPPWIALTTWLVDVAQFLPWRTHPRVLLVRYEELVRDPYQIVSRILERVCGLMRLDRTKFMTTYASNPYTRLFSWRVKTWSVQETGVVVDANSKPVAHEVLSSFAASLELTVNPEYARLYGFEPIGFREALVAMGYAEVVQEMLAEVRPDRKALRPDPAARRMLGKKVLYALMTGLPNHSGIWALTRPVLQAR